MRARFVTGVCLYAVMQVAGHAADATHLNVSLPGVPVDMMASVEDAARQAVPGARPPTPPVSPDATPENLGPVSLRVKPGVNEVVTISRGYLNRIVTPYHNPRVRTAQEDAAIEVVDNVVLISTHSEKAVGLFITPEEGGDSISLSLIPQLHPPREVHLSFADSAYAQATGAMISARAKRWEQKSPYVRTLTELAQMLARLKVPPGYVVARPRPQDAAFLCEINHAAVHVAQVIEGAKLRVGVLPVKNISDTAITLRESDCYRDGVLAVAAWPSATVAPGESVELYVVRRRDGSVTRRAARPSTVTRGP